jgi:hypothetical protein
VMADIQITSSVNVAGLQRMVVQIVAFGRRTLIEQCVTSAAFICLEAQANTTAVAIGQIDAELGVEVRGFTKKGRLSKAKNPAERRVSALSGVRVPLAVLIVMARTNPESKYSRLTGNRWPLNLNQLPTGPGTAKARQAMIGIWVSRMTLARHSSTHFLQHGWASAIRKLLTDPNFYAGRSKYRLNQQANVNPLNLLDTGTLGAAIVEISGDNCLVQAENAVGGEGNAVLAAKHRAALIREGTPPLQDAIDKEETTMRTKVQEYFDRGLKQKFHDL